MNGDVRWCLWLKDASDADLTHSPVLVKRVAALEAARRNADRSATKKLAATPALFGKDRQPTETFLAFPQTFTDNRGFMTVGYMNSSTVIGMKIYSTQPSILMDSSSL